ncbi:MAG: hypothetical protein CVU87_07105 [Firmicutes bacterium HGW-Firmicutes-12]|jgi:hypothetical protein|nr:MAG: hypothetical protein CVU87_07105 [Firmicutes bacterium HGW-Firmicutes-12]
MKMPKSKNGTIRESFELKEISLTDRDLYFDYMKISEFPTNVFSWYFPYLWSSSQSSIRKIRWSMFDDMLVTFAHTRRDILYLWCLPFGPGGLEKVIEVLYQSLKYCTQWNKEKGFKPMVRTINNPQLEYLQKYSNFSKLFYTKRLNGIERLHSMKNLLTLPGRDFGKIRNKMRKFHKNQPEALLREFEQQDYDALLELQDYWNNTTGKKYKRIYDSVRYCETIKHFQKLQHLILVME